MPLWATATTSLILALTLQSGFVFAQAASSPQVTFELDDSVTKKWPDADLARLKQIVTKAVIASKSVNSIDQPVVVATYKDAQIAAFDGSGSMTSWFEHSLTIAASDSTGKQVLRKTYKGRVAGAYKAGTFNTGQTAGIVNSPVNYGLVLNDLAARLRADPIRAGAPDSSIMGPRSKNGGWCGDGLLCEQGLTCTENICLASPARKP